MTRRSKKPLSGDYKVGYGSPPSNTRFRKGVSGNPKGRPRGVTTARVKKLALQEAYRSIPVREGGEVFFLPAIQAVIRQQLRLAANGNGPAQRALIAMVQIMEQEEVQAATTATESIPYSSVTDEERARALMAFLERTKHIRAMIAKEGNGNSDRGAS
jgi:hypothetical protein